MSSTCAAFWRTDDDLEVGVLEADLPRIDDFDAHILDARPVGVQARRQDVAEAAVDPHESALVVLQVDDFGAARKRTALDDHVELLVGKPRLSLRNNIDLHLAERVEEPVPTRGQQALELAVAEVQTDFVAANLRHA